MDELFAIAESLASVLATAAATTTIKQPTLLTNVVLKPHQLSCLQWLACLYDHNRISGLLADEMGLGKTLEAIAFIAHVMEEGKQEQQRRDVRKHLFLIVTPLSTVDNWMQELRNFTAHIGVVDYTGSKDDRERKRREMVEYRQAKGAFNFNVMVTTPQTVIMDIEFLRRLRWDVLVVDEAHLLKNENALIYSTLSSLRTEARLAMTGTPIQNNLKELFALLQFANPSIFTDAAAFLAHFRSVTSSSHQRQELSRLLRPFMLRRLKSDVLSDLPRKSEILIYTGLSAMQKRLYKSLLQRDATALASENPRALNNLVMALRKCVNHPYLFEGVEPEPFVEGDHIFHASGKLATLDKLLRWLRRHRRRVLLFSQMTAMLDILQDYLSSRHYSFERLDGSVRAQDRYAAINRFSTKRGKGSGDDDNDDADDDDNDDGRDDGDDGEKGGCKLPQPSV